MPVGGEEKARHFILQLDPVFQGAVIVADVQRTGRAHAGENAGGEHHLPMESNSCFDRSDGARSAPRAGAAEAITTRTATRWLNRSAETATGKIPACW